MGDDNYDYAYDDYLFHLYEDDLKRQGSIQEQIERIQNYLCRYGDTVYERVSALKNEAVRLIENEEYSSSLVHSAISIEILIRFCVIKPILQGLILSDGIAGLVENKIITRSTQSDRNYLPMFLSHWRVEINSYKLPSGELWYDALKDVFYNRNVFMHVGKSPSRDVVLKGIECIALLLQIIAEFACNIGFTLEKTGVWHDINCGKDIFTDAEYNKYFDPESPFKKT